VDYWIKKAMQFNDTTKSSEILNYNVSEGPHIKVKVSGIVRLVDALIDSGSNICAVKRDVLPDSIKSKIKPWTSSSNFSSFATLSDGNPIEVLGRVNLRVSCLGKTVELPFSVVAELDLPMLLGTVWIRKSRAMLQSDGKKLGVTFGGKKEKKGWRMDVCHSPYVSVKVDGIDKVISALVDTGATESSIKREIVTEFHTSKAIPTYNSTTLANGKEIEELTGLVSLKITFQGIVTCIENVDITSNINDQLVLGMDWIHKTHAVIQSDGSRIIVSQPRRNNRRSNRLITFLSKQLNSTFGSVSRISSLVSNLM